MMLVFRTDILIVTVMHIPYKTHISNNNVGRSLHINSAFENSDAPLCDLCQSVDVLFSFAGFFVMILCNTAPPSGHTPSSVTQLFT